MGFVGGLGFGMVVVKVIYNVCLCLSFTPIFLLLFSVSVLILGGGTTVAAK